MKITRQRINMLLLAATLALPLAVQAEDGAPQPEAMAEEHEGPGTRHGDRGFGHGPGAHGTPPYLHGLDLTETQKDKVFTIMHAQVPYLREQGKALDSARQALQALGHAQAQAYDDAKAVAQAQALSKAVANLELQRVRTGQKLLAVLTPEQRKQLDERRQRRSRHAPE